MPSISRRGVALAAAFAGWLLLAGPGLPGSTTPVASAHSQLVTTAPGAGAVVDVSPVELRLVFSEPIEASFTALDVVDRYGRVLVANAGAPDPADPRTFVAHLVEPLPDGVYSVEWHAISAADGHATSGFFTFGVGIAVSPGAVTAGATTGTLHGGHGAATATAEVAARLMSYLGLLLALGLALIGWLVLRPAAATLALPGGAGPTADQSRVAAPAPGFAARLRGLVPAAPDPVGLARAIAAAQVVGLLLAAAGAIGLAMTTADGPSIDVGRLLTETRTGMLLLARVVVGVAGAGGAVALLALGRPIAATAVGGVAALAGVVCVALGGHASAGSSATVAAMVVHLVAAATWLSGVVALAVCALRWRDARLGVPFLRAAVPRFSALALVSVGLVGFSGLLLEWTLIRSLVPFETAYGLALVTKVVVFALALALGAVNYVDGGRGAAPADLRRRLGAEALLAVGVLIAAGNLASGSPPGAEQPVTIERAASTVAAARPIDLEILPGRPGANRLDVVVPDGLDPRSTVDLLVQRLDASAGEARYETRRLAGAVLEHLSPGAHFVVDGGLLPAASSWEATAIIRGPDGSEATRQRFVLALDGERIIEGAARPPADPAAVLAILLLVVSLVGAAFALGGGSLPRVHAPTGRRAVATASVIGIALGSLVLAVGIGG